MGKTKKPRCFGLCSTWAHRSTFCCCTFAIFCVLIATVFPVVIHKVMDSEIRKSIVLDSPDAGNYKDWQDDTNPHAQPIYFQIYFFNLTNPTEVLNGSKPILSQLGPYSYREHKVRYKVDWLENGNVIRYKTWHFFLFDASTSGPGLSEDDSITTVSLALLGVYENLRKQDNLPGGLKGMLRTILFKTLGPTLFHTRPMRELFWGYKDDPVLKYVNEKVLPTCPDFPPLQPNATSVEDAEALATEDMMYTGKDNIGKIFQYIRYQNMSMLHACTGPPPDSTVCPLYQNEWSDADALSHGWTPVWQPQVNRVWGTDGSQFTMGLKSGGQVPVFVDALMRSSYLENRNGESVSDLYDIHMQRYRLRPQDLLNSTENAPFYMFGPSGVMNFTSVVGFPMFVSKPHFLDGDPALVSSVVGLSPNAERHDTFIDVEPITGISMRAGKRMMFSGQLQSLDLRHDQTHFENKWLMTISSDVPSGLYLPVLWIDSFQQLTADQAKEFNDGVTLFSNISDGCETYGPYAAIASGVLGLISALFVVYQKRRESRRTDEMRERLAETE